jgi:hypothetical protein
VDYRLAGPWEKLKRAEEQGEKLHAEMAAFIDSDAHGVSGKYDEQTGWLVVSARITVDKRLRWGVTAGEIVHDLRSSLDHIMFVISRGNSREGFPIFTSFEEYTTPRDDGVVPRDAALKRIPQRYWALIESFQPYHRVGDPERDLLAQLKWLNNTDKHRVVPAAFTFVDERAKFAAQAEFVRDDIERAEFELLIEPGAIVKHGTPLYRVRTDPPTKKVGVDANFPLNVAFGKTRRLVSTAEIAGMMDRVEEIIRRFDVALP